MDIGRALRHTDQMSRAAKRRERTRGFRRNAKVARVVLIVALFVGFVVLAVILPMGAGPLPLVAFAIKWLSMPFLWFGSGSIIDPGAPMLVPTDRLTVHRRVQVAGETTDMLIRHEGSTAPITVGRRGAIALTAFGAALYIAAVVLLVISRRPDL